MMPIADHTVIITVTGKGHKDRDPAVGQLPLLGIHDRLKIELFNVAYSKPEHST